MKKTKLGISGNVFCGMIFFIALFGGFVPTILVVGYVLLYEEERYFKEIAISAISLLIVFSCVDALIAMIPYIYGFVDNFVSIFGGYCETKVLGAISNAMYYVVDILRTIVFVVIGLKMFMGKQINISIITENSKKSLVEVEERCVSE